jgi:hypothetical protein
MEDGAKFCPSCGTPAGGAAPAVSAPAPAAEKVGNIRKCPACGAEVPSMTAVCPSCGHEFSNVQVVNSVQVFFQKLDNLSEADFVDSNALLSGRSIKQGFFGIIWFFAFYMLIVIAMLPLQTLLYSESSIATKIAGIAGAIVMEFLVSLMWRAKGPKWTPADLRKQHYIEAFPIPNAKEDILEFVILASNMIKTGGTKWTGKGKITLKWNDIWRTKCEQAYNKAKIALGSDKDAIAQIEGIFKQKKIIK